MLSVLTAKAVITVVVLVFIGISGFAWIKKENTYQISARELAGQRKKELDLLTQAGHLQAEYLRVTETTIIEHFARTKLNMHFPIEMPDTVLVDPMVLMPTARRSQDESGVGEGTR